MRELTRSFVVCLGLGCAALVSLLATGAAVRAQTSLQIEKQRERLLVSVMALRDGVLIADDAASYSAYQQHKEQVLTLDLDVAGQRRTLLVDIWDRDGGGVKVGYLIVDGLGNLGERREFVMYPFIDKTAQRAEPLRLPIMRVVDSGNDQLIEMARIELQLTMKRTVRLR